MALPDELDITELDADGHADPEASWTAVRDAIDAASDQDHTTWLVADGKRVARIAPADEIRDGFDEWFTRFRAQRRGWQADEVRTWLEAAWNAAPAGHHEILTQVMARQIEEIHRALGLERDEEGDLVHPDAVTAWAESAGVSASEFRALDPDRRRALSDQFYARLHGEH